jgi:uncharacterized protein
VGIADSPRPVAIDSARRLAVVCQRLSGSPRRPVTAESIHELVRHLGCLQLDPTAIVARNHLLVVFSRLGPYRQKLVDSLLWDQRLLYEYWAHQASIVPTEDRALHAALPPRWLESPQEEAWLTRRALAVERVLERLAQVDAVHASDFDEHAEKYESGWGQRSEITDSIALLWLRGTIVPAGRDGRGRRWALADRWFAGPITAIPEQHEAERDAAVRAIRALGIATPRQVRAHFMRNRYRHLDATWKQLKADGVIIPVALGVKGDWCIHVDDMPLLERIEAGEFEPRTTLLSPFDNLICDRARTEALWGFDFRLEIYVPKTARWGYFVMPLLHGDRLVARFDLAVDRAAGRLEVRGERWEPGWEGRRRPIRARNKALGELARFVGVDSYNVSPS